MLQRILDSAGLQPTQCADLLGLDRELFAEWTAGSRPIPRSYIPLLSGVLGVQPDIISKPDKRAGGRPSDILPAVWFKLRGENLVDADRSCVLLMRHLALNMSELEELTGSRPAGWETLFEQIRRDVDSQAPPREQGRQAAKLLLASTGLSVGATGIGEALRPNLRRLGVLIVESPLPGSQVEGMSFYLGGAGVADRPCVFGNTYRTTWFRRNVVLAHEVAHAIFDAPSAGPMLDFKREDASSLELAEERAQSFAIDLLVPERVLRHVAISKGLDWTSLQPADLAYLVAETHAEPRAILNAAVDAGFVDVELASRYAGFEIGPLVKQLSKHALTVTEFLKSGEASAARYANYRTTTIPSMPMRLPAQFVSAVLRATAVNEISPSRASELLMIDEDMFDTRFSAVLSAIKES